MIRECMKHNNCNVIITETHEKDLMNIQKLWNDGEVMKWVGFPNGLNISTHRIKEWYERVQKNEYSHHFVVYTRDDIFCGELFYLKDVKNKRAGLDIKFLPDLQGKGFARESLIMLIAFIFRNEKEIDAVWTEPSLENVAARKLYTRCGLTEKERPRDMEPGDSYWELTKTDWCKKYKNDPCWRYSGPYALKIYKTRVCL